MEAVAQDLGLAPHRLSLRGIDGGYGWGGRLRRDRGRAQGLGGGVAGLEVPGVARQPLGISHCVTGTRGMGSDDGDLGRPTGNRRGWGFLGLRRGLAGHPIGPPAYADLTRAVVPARRVQRVAQRSENTIRQ